MRWFVYPDTVLERACRDARSSGELGLELVHASECFLGRLLSHVEHTTDPTAASAFLVPVVCNILGDGTVDGAFDRLAASLPWFADAPGRHVFFLLGDNARVPPACRASAVFMPSCSRASRALPLCYFADAPNSPPGPLARADVDVAFQGTTATGGGLRARLVAALLRCRTKRVVCRVTDGYFHLAYTPAQQQRLRAEYLDLVARSRFVLCPRGDGLSSLRFFEVLAHGRIPVLVADETALPLEREIPYADLCVRVPESQVERWEAYVDAFCAAHPDLERCSSLAGNASRHWFTTQGLARFVECSLRHWHGASYVGPR